jgi:hypothetical protein
MVSGRTVGVLKGGKCQEMKKQNSGSNRGGLHKLDVRQERTREQQLAVRERSVGTEWRMLREVGVSPAPGKRGTVSTARRKIVRKTPSDCPSGRGPGPMARASENFPCL